ncbi:hypothetical protein MMC24_004911 [Lignoscripta atroalba]|nr:hypothetical protein [Lignoscripta atroalba]
MYVAQQERPHPVPPPLFLDRGAPQRTTPFSTPPSSSGTMLPGIPRSPQAPTPVTTSYNGRLYSLDVVQQPIRARMCGFGDKDRRPITPPPCIRLIVRDAATHNPIDINEIDTNHFVLTVDLWSADGTREVNLVRHSATSPSISAATSSSYPPPPPTPPSFPYGPPMTQVHVGLVSAYSQPPGLNNLQHQPQHMYQPSSDPYQQHPVHPYQQHPANPYQQQQPLPPQPQSQTQSYYTTASGTPITPTNCYHPQNMQGQAPLMSPQQMIPQPSAIDPRAAPSGMFTRNLIGSLCVSAFKLTDPDSAMGIWFILQDLSVRTEGSFRLKMNFVNVGSLNLPQQLNSGSAPVLASTFSNIFQVFSAKKFPGVIESTALSKCFAIQGIKIPIRKDGPRPSSTRDRDDDDE